MNSTDTDTTVLEIRGLTKRYGGFEAVSGLELRVSRGEIFALLGPNGAGKTTTIRMLMGILQPTRGTAFIQGRDCFLERVEVKRLVRQAAGASRRGARALRTPARIPLSSRRPRSGCGRSGRCSRGRRGRARRAPPRAGCPA